MESTASPQLIDPFEHLLDSPASNKKKYVGLLSEKPNKMMEAYPGAYLYYKGTRYFVLDESQKKITYYMSWKERQISGHTAAYQVLVWSDIGTPEIRSFASIVFFDLLFGEYDLIVTDRLQSPSGRRFWLSIVATAIKSGYPIYLVDLINNTKVQMHSSQEILDKSDFIWPKHEIGKSRLLCIAKTKIW